MKSTVSNSRFWTTASFGGDTDTSPVELTSLGDHLGVCKNPHRHLFALYCIADVTRGFMAARLITTLLGIALLVAIVSLTL